MRTMAESAANQTDRVAVMGVPFDAITASETVDRVFAAMQAGRGGQLVTANLDHLLRCRRERAYADLVRDAEMNVADGMPIVWAARLRGRPVPERVTGADLVHDLVARAAADGASVYLLGGNPGVAEQAAAVWVEKHPQLKIAGYFCPEFGFEKDAEQMAEIRAKLVASAPSLVLVALGSPKQEYLVKNIRESLPRAWWVGIGISFSFVTGDVRRAPRWMQRTGLEWAFRLLCEPKRLAKRYLVDGVPFALVLLGSALLARLGLKRLYDSPKMG